MPVQLTKIQQYSIEKKKVIFLFILIFFIISLILSYILNRKDGVYLPYTSTANIFFNGMVSLFLWSLVVIIPITITFIILINAKTKSEAGSILLLNMILSIGVSLIIFLILFYLFPYYLGKNPIIQSNSMGAFGFGDDLAPLGQYFIIWLILSFFPFFSHWIYNKSSTMLLKIITIIIIAAFILVLYSGSSQSETRYIDYQCHDLFLFVMAKNPTTEISNYARFEYLRNYPDDDIDKNYGELNSKWGQICKKNLEHYISTYSLFGNGGFGWSNSKNTIEAEKQKIRDWSIKQ